MKINRNVFGSALAVWCLAMAVGTGAGAILARFVVWVLGIATPTTMRDLKFYGVMLVLGLMWSFWLATRAPKKELTPE